MPIPPFLSPLTTLFSQDIFSLGCVIAELFLDGRTFLDLGQLLNLRSSPSSSSHPALSNIDPDIRELICHMISPDPNQRWSARDYLDKWPSPIFPNYFSTLIQPLFGSLSSMDTDARLAAVQSTFPILKSHLSKPRMNPQSDPSSIKQEKKDSSSVGSVANLVDPESNESEGERKLGTNASRSLADRVAALLDEAKLLSTRLSESNERHEQEGGLFFSDDVTPNNAERVKESATTSLLRAPPSEPRFVEEIATDQSTEFESRDPSSSSSWIIRIPPPSPHDPPLDPSLVNQGWTWTSPWSVRVPNNPSRMVPNNPSCSPDPSTSNDNEGWEYRHDAQGGSEREGGGEGEVASSSQYQWTGLPSEGCLMRRRVWVRSRARRITLPSPSPAPTKDPEPLPAPLMAYDPDGLVLVVGLLCSLLRGTRLVESKLAAMRLLVEVRCHLEGNPLLSSHLTAFLSPLLSLPRILILISIISTLRLLSTVRTRSRFKGPSHTWSHF